MLKAEYQQLSPQAISHLCGGSQEGESILVQVYNITINKNDKISCILSDGLYCVKAFLRDKNIIKPGTYPLYSEQHENAIIRIRQHVVAGSGKSIGIMECDLIC